MSVPWVAAIPVGLLACVYVVALVWSMVRFVEDGKEWLLAAILWSPLLIAALVAVGMLVLRGFGVQVS